VLPHVIKQFVIGKTISEERLEEKEIIIDDVHKVIFLSTELTTVVTESKPTGKHNLAFPSAVIKDNTLLWYNIKPDSVLSNFIQPRGQTSSSSHNKGYDGAQNPQNIPEGEAINPNDEENPDNIAANSETNNGSAKKVKDEVQEILQTEAFMEDFTFTYEKTAMIRRFLLLNNSPYTLNVSFDLKAKDNEFNNFRPPSSTIWISVKPKMNAQIFAMSKIYPNVSWGEYEIRFNIEKHLGGSNSPNIKERNMADEDKYSHREPSFQMKNININTVHMDFHAQDPVVTDFM